MIINKDVRRNETRNMGLAESALSWRKLAGQRPSPRQKRQRRIIGIVSILLLIVTLLAVIRFAAVAAASNDQVVVRTGNQQPATIDTRQSIPISPDLSGANVFPQLGTTSLDQANGIMNYGAPLPARLMNAHIRLLRFPGGTWSEQHYTSLDQLVAFDTLLQRTQADGLVQARLSGPINGNYLELKDVTYRAAIAGRWVDFINNPKSDQRVGKYAYAPYHPIKFWSVGNEPDTLINPTTGKLYTVNEYVQDFIIFSTAMHKSDPTIKVFGPELSQFYGPGAGPKDANGQLWMEGFLKGVGDYEQAHHVTLLDGISFHAYPPASAVQDPSLLLSSSDAWNYLLPSLHQIISQYLGQDMPVAITEVNTNLPAQQPPSRRLAALWWADTLGTLMNQQVEYTIFASASDASSTTGATTPYPLLAAQNGRDGRPTPMYRVMELFSHLQSNLIPIQVQREPISLYVTQDDTHQTLSLLFINKSNMNQLAQISQDGSPLSVNLWPSLDVSLAAYSMVVITLHRTGGAEAYSYIAPGADNGNTSPVVSTVCGHKTDALANTIPC